MRRSIISIAAVLLIATGCGSDDSTGSGSPGHPRCRTEDPPTAENRVIWFLGDVQQGRDSTIEGGVDDPFGCAYAQLCQARRDQMTEAEFRETGGEALSTLLTADSHAGPSAYVDRGLSAEHPGRASLDPRLAATWVQVEAVRYERIDDRTIVSGSGIEERWRVDLVREDGRWRVCELSRLPS